MPQLRNEELTLNDKIKFDSKGGAILGVLEGPVADFMHSTRNGRNYSEELWENVFNNPLVKEQFENGGIVGELDHPADREDICSEKIAVIMPEPPVKKNGEYYGKFNILDTPCGRIVHTLAKAGFKLGVSSRGTGDVDDYTHDVDPDTYDFTCFDVVLLPSVKSARMNLVTEGLQPKKVSYKKLLKESLEQANDKDRKIMEETLNNLNISLEEEVNKEKCVICGADIEGYGNNAEPVKSGRCCDKCNAEVVIPARLSKLNESMENKVTKTTANFTKPKGQIICTKGEQQEEVEKLLKPHYEKIEVTPGKGGNVNIKYYKKSLGEALSDDDFDGDILDLTVLDIPTSDDVTVDMLDTTGESEVTVKEDETIDEPIETETCEDCDAKLIDLLHQFLKKEDIEVEEKDDIEQIEKDFIELFHEVTCPECKPEEEETIPEIESETEGEDKEEVQEPEEAEDDGSKELVEQLQKLLKENKSLKEEVENLQNEKAVSGTKVEKLNEDLNNYKLIAANAGKKALSLKSFETKNVELSKQVTSLKEQIEKQNKQNELQESRISKLIESKKLLEEKVELMSNDSKEIKKLNESLNSTKDSYDKKLTEAIKKYQSTLKLVEKYKGLAHDVAERYIESKAVSIGVTVNEIKNRLNESYTLDDVDNVCEKLQKYSLNISRLPFVFEKPDTTTRVKIREDKSKDPLKNVDSQYDDSVDDYLLDLAKLRK